jgi:hypothetical protein
MTDHTVHEDAKTLSSIDELEGLDDRPTVKVFVPEWNCNVNLRAMRGADRERYDHHVTNGGKQDTVNMIGMRAKMIGACLVNESGERLFNERQEKELSKRSAKALEFLFGECLTLNGMTEEDVKELEENFTTDPS